MNVYIGILVEILRNTELVCVLAYVAYRRARRFFHNVAQRAGKLQRTAAAHGKRFYAEHITAELCPCKSVHDADLVLAINPVGKELFGAQHFDDRFCIDRFFRRVAVDDLLRRFAAYGCDLTFEITHARLLRITQDKLVYAVVGEAELTPFQSVALELLGDQMIFRNRQLLVVGIAVHVYDLHSVEQGQRNGFGGVCGCDEKTVRKINGQLNEMVAERLVLIGVQYLKQCTCRVAVRVGCQFIHFVEQHNGV